MFSKKPMEKWMSSAGLYRMLLFRTQAQFSHGYWNTTKHLWYQSQSGVGSSQSHSLSAWCWSSTTIFTSNVLCSCWHSSFLPTWPLQRVFLLSWWVNVLCWLFQEVVCIEAKSRTLWRRFKAREEKGVFKGQNTSQNYTLWLETLWTLEFHNERLGLVGILWLWWAINQMGLVEFFFLKLVVEQWT